MGHPCPHHVGAKDQRKTPRAPPRRAPLVSSTSRGPWRTSTPAVRPSSIGTSRASICWWPAGTAPSNCATSAWSGQSAFDARPPPEQDDPATRRPPTPVSRRFVRVSINSCSPESYWLTGHQSRRPVLRATWRRSSCRGWPSTRAWTCTRLVFSYGRCAQGRVCTQSAAGHPSVPRGQSFASSLVHASPLVVLGPERHAAAALGSSNHLWCADCAGSLVSSATPRACLLPTSPGRHALTRLSLDPPNRMPWQDIRPRSPVQRVRGARGPGGGHWRRQTPGENVDQSRLEYVSASFRHVVRAMLASRSNVQSCVEVGPPGDGEGGAPGVHGMMKREPREEREGLYPWVRSGVGYGESPCDARKWTAG